MGTENMAGNGAGAPDLAPAQIKNPLVETDFNREFHAELRSLIGDLSYDLWIVSQGLTFVETEPGKGKVLVPPNGFVLSWLKDPSREYYPSFCRLFRERSMVWDFAPDIKTCEAATKIFLPAHLKLEGIPDDREPDTSGAERVKSPQQVKTHCFGQLPTGDTSFDDFVVGDSPVNQAALDAVHEVIKANGDSPEFRAIILWGEKGSGRKMLINAAINELRRLYKTVRIFAATGKGLQAQYAGLFSTGSSGETVVDRPNLKAFEELLFSAQCLFLPDLNETTARAQGTRRVMLTAIQDTRRRGRYGGRVIISLPSPPTEETLGEDLFTELQSLPVFRVEKVSASLLPEIAQRAFVKQSRLSFDGVNEQSELEPEILAWVVRRSEDLAQILAKMKTLAFYQRRLRRPISLEEAQAQLWFPLDADDLLSLVYEFFGEEKTSEEDVEPDDESSPYVALSLARHVALDVLSLRLETVENWFPTGSSWAEQVILRDSQKAGKFLAKSEEFRKKFENLKQALTKRFPRPRPELRQVPVVDKK